MRPAPVLFIAALLTACAGAPPPAPGGAGGVTVLDAADLQWTALNPARGAASPMAATLWGDRGADVPTGFFVRFVDGFRSPPHIHNVTYRGVVVEGLVHNDHPDANDLWMPAGSYWTQPQGANHVTAAKGVSVAFIEIDQGPYLVRPVAQAFATDEQAVNLPVDQLKWAPAQGAVETVQVAPHRKLYRLPPKATLTTAPGAQRLVVILGEVTLAGQARKPGTLARTEGALTIACGAQPCVVWLRRERP